MSNLVVKAPFAWKHGIAMADKVPAGAPIEVVDAGTIHERFYVKPSFFPVGSFARHDATYYGCRVVRENVEEVPK